MHLFIVMFDCYKHICYLRITHMCFIVFTSMTSKQNKETRWRLLDSILAKGEPLSQEQIFAIYREKKIKVKGNDYLPSLRKDLDIFKKALKVIDKENMLVVGRGALPKVADSGLDHRTRTYYYREKGFSVIPYLTEGMTDYEFRNLIIAINRLKGTLSEQTFEGVRFAIQSRIEADYQKGPVIVDYEDNRRLKGREYLPVFYSAIKDKQSMQIEYQTFKGKAFSFEFHPYLLKQYNERWFVFGLRPDKKNPYTNVPLDRLTKMPGVIGHYIEDRPADYLSYFENIVGVSKDRKANAKDLKHLIIRISDIEAWGRITTKPLPTQTVVTPFDEKDGYGRISLDLYPNNELFSKILSWGEAVEIESSDDGNSVRAKMVSLIQRISEQYSEISACIQ